MPLILSRVFHSWGRSVSRSIRKKLLFVVISFICIASTFRAFACDLGGFQRSSYQAEPELKLSGSGRAHLRISTMDEIPPNLLTATAADLSRLLAEKKITAVELVELYLQQITLHNHQGMKLHAVISTAPRPALIEYAKQLDEELGAGKFRSPLHGIPIIVKVRGNIRYFPCKIKRFRIANTSSYDMHRMYSSQEL